MIGRAVACIALVAALVGGCGERTIRVLDERTRVAAASDTVGGLEVRWWVVDDARGVLGPALAAARAQPAPFSAALVERWRSAGLRVVAVKLDDLDALRAALPTVGADRSNWFGTLGDWTEVAGGIGVRGPGAGGAWSVDAGGSAAVRVPAGRVRLLARSWTRPTPGGGAGQWVELTPQVEAARPAQAAGDWAMWSPREREPDWARGVAFLDLRAGFTGQGGVAYLIVGESPATDWSTLPEPMPARSPAERQAQLRAARSAPGPASERTPGAVKSSTDRAFVGSAGDELGPAAPHTPTLGEAMLTSPGVGGRPGAGDRRAVVVLIPRPPTRFELLGGT